MLEGIVLTSPALRVKPTHPIVGAMAPIVSMVAPKFQFKGANKRGIPVSRDLTQLLAKYYDPWSKQVSMDGAQYLRKVDLKTYGSSCPSISLSKETETKAKTKRKEKKMYATC
ncbi:hypothetical protein ACFX11_003571 [Malus domestica]